MGCKTEIPSYYPKPDIISQTNLMKLAGNTKVSIPNIFSFPFLLLRWLFVYFPEYEMCSTYAAKVLLYFQEIWTTARRVRNGWAYRGKGNLKIPNEMLINLKDKRLKCLLYNIPRGKFIPARCGYRASVLCVYDANGNAASSAMTTPPDSGPCAGVGPLGKLSLKANYKMKQSIINS